MLEDIKNIMNSKRLNDDSKASCAFVQDTKTGLLYDVKTDSEFLFGRLLKSTIVIEELYISRSHSTIRYENYQYFLKDNNSGTGTYLNYKKINKEVPLQHGDLIAYTDNSKTWDFVYKFCLISNPKKKLRLEEDNSTAEKLKTAIEPLHNEVKKLKNDKAEILKDFKVRMDEFKKLINDRTEMIIAINNKEMIKLRENNQKLNEQLDIHRISHVMQKKMLDENEAKQYEPVELVKIQVNKLLENDFQCAICNEVVIRPSVSNCNHIFCESCLDTWLTRSINCPTCRSNVVSTTYCLALDTFITNLYDILGGKMKEQHRTLKIERIKKHPPQMAKRGRRRAGPNQSSRSRSDVPGYDLIDSSPTRNNPRYSNGEQRVIGIVDLTNTSR